jgi:cytochrome c peroxidase
MPTSRASFVVRGSIFVAVYAAACSNADPAGDPGAEAQGIEVRSSSLTAQQRLTNCNQDPRVVAGLVTAQICAGADIFFRETFNGNGRTCGSCHPANNNFTIDSQSVSALHASNPSDPLFVFETNPDLAQLEQPSALLSGALVLENVDDFQDPTHKFVLRGVPHTLSLKTSIAADTGDGTTNPPVERTGWGGDGAPGDGSLRQFLAGAVNQHYPKTLLRRPGVDFRVPTSQELDLVLAFQLALGRMNDLDLTQVNLFDADANLGRQIFLDPVRGRCNVCHANAGASSLDTGKNRNFDTGTRQAPGISGGTFLGRSMFDGGFGGQGLAAYNIVAFNIDGQPNGFGNGTFNTPPIIEAVDTSPFFHTNVFSGGIESAVFFYASDFFASSPAGKDLEARFGSKLVISSDDGFRIGRFLRALNVALNLDMAKQRLRAALTLANRFGDSGVDIQRGLLTLGQAEIDDALGVINDPNVAQPFYPVAVDRLGLATTEIAAAMTAPASSRAGHISNAVSRVENARDTIGANVNYQLGQGNLMF